jgi:hypothetical protein
MIRKDNYICIDFTWLYVTISNSIIDHNTSRNLKKLYPLKAIAETKNYCRKEIWIFG